MGEDTMEDLVTIAKLVGTRPGMLRVMAETQLQAATDSLTGLLNRRSFDERASDVRRNKQPLSLVIADIDNFKMLNDSYGHETGDRALQVFAQIIRETVRADDIVCRHGGDEFVIAFPGCSVESVRMVLEDMRLKIHAAFALAGLPSSASFGAVQAELGEELSSLIARGDAALLQAKRQGRDRVCVHDAAGGVVTPGFPRTDELHQLGDGALELEFGEQPIPA